MSSNIYDATQDAMTRIAGGTLYSDLPISTVIGLFTEQAPAGFLYCDNTAYSATDYPELWALLPSTVKDTTNNTFTIDLRESTLKGVGTTSKTVGAHNAIALGEFIDDRLQDHTHQLNTTLGGGTAADVFFRYDGSTVRNSGNVKTGRKGATTEVKSTGIRWYIKAKNCAVPADFMSKVDEALDEVISPTSGIVELDTGWLGTCKYSKSGNTVTLSFSQLRGNSTSVSTTIATLPSNLRPKENCYCITWIDDTDNIQILNVTGTGAITVGGTAGVRTAYAFGSVTFVTN